MEQLCAGVCVCVCVCVHTVKVLVFSISPLVKVCSCAIMRKILKFYIGVLLSLFVCYGSPDAVNIFSWPTRWKNVMWPELGKGFAAVAEQSCSSAALKLSPIT